MSSPDAEQSRWFSLEVQPHEPALRAYLQARFPLLRDADDIIQETDARLLREKDAGRVHHALPEWSTARSLDGDSQFTNWQVYERNASLLLNYQFHATQRRRPNQLLPETYSATGRNLRFSTTVDF